MDLHLHNQVIAVTGGSSGIGRAAALAFAREGCQIAICGRNQEKLEETRDFFLKEGYQIYTEVVDVSCPEMLSSFGANVFRHFGHIDVWINNAGGNITKPYMELAIEEWNTIIATNLTSVFWGTHVAVEYMSKARKGVILNTSSYTALIPVEQKVAYCAAKAGVVSITKTTAGEFAPLGIRVNCVIPGLIETPIASARINANRESLCSQIALQRFGTPQDLAGIYVFLASDQAQFITGAAYEVSGGKLCIQSPADAWN